MSSHKEFCTEQRAVRCTQDEYVVFHASTLPASDRALRTRGFDFVVVEPEDSTKDLDRVFTEQRGALDFRRRIGQFDWVSDGQILAALWMVDFDHCPCFSQCG